MLPSPSFDKLRMKVCRKTPVTRLPCKPGSTMPSRFHQVLKVTFQWIPTYWSGRDDGQEFGMTAESEVRKIFSPPQISPAHFWAWTGTSPLRRIKTRWRRLLPGCLYFVVFPLRLMPLDGALIILPLRPMPLDGAPLVCRLTASLRSPYLPRKVNTKKMSSSLFLRHPRTITLRHLLTITLRHPPT